MKKKAIIGMITGAVLVATLSGTAMAKNIGQEVEGKVSAYGNGKITIEDPYGKKHSFSVTKATKTKSSLNKKIEVGSLVEVDANAKKQAVKIEAERTLEFNGTIEAWTNKEITIRYGESIYKYPTAARVKLDVDDDLGSLSKADVIGLYAELTMNQNGEITKVEIDD